MLEYLDFHHIWDTGNIQNGYRRHLELKQVL